MDIIVFIMSICSLIMGVFFSIGELKGHILLQFLARIVGFIGVTFPIIYWLILAEILKY